MFVFFCCQFVLAQNISVNTLQEVLVSDTFLKNNSKSQHIIQLSDSIIMLNKTSLTSLLNYNSSIYFKENGLGMVSSPSFRGTTAQQTAVIWNGININSQLTGQTDFNTISTKNFDNIFVRAGGGSAIYGSSAVGGSIHLNNDLNFNDKIVNNLQLDYGSFNTLGIHFNSKISSNKFVIQIGLSRNSSDNNYEYVQAYNWKGEKQRNINGQFYNNNLNVNFGYKFNSNNFLKFYSQTSNSNRNFSLISETDTKTKYIESFDRNLLEYEGNFDNLTINFKNAFIYENYEYYGNIDYDGFSSGKVESYTSKLDFGYKLSKSIKINSVLDYNRSKGFGTSINNKIREISSISLLFSHQKNNWQNEFVIRKEATSAYKSPVLFSLGSTYKFNSIYKLKINISRNFRIPTYNDLYYFGGGGFGNPDLKPEKAFQAEFGNIFTLKKIKVTQTFYAIKTTDLITWLPTQFGGSSPENTSKVMSYGSETQLIFKHNIRNHYFNFNVNYAYTVSQNEETKKQLLYVPFHKLTTSINYSFKNFELNYQFLFNGFVYKLSDNNPNEIVKAYKISNINVNYSIGNQKKYLIGFQISNIFNQKYQSVEGRFMPGINFNTYLNLKF